MKYQHLFTPIELGSVKIKNRVFMSPLHPNLSENPNGRYTKRFIDYYEERAKNDIGLIITGHVKAERTIDPYPQLEKFPCLDTEEEIPFFKALVDTVHKHGTKIAVELSPATGRVADTIIDGYHPAAPSEVPLLINPEVNSRAITKEEIKQLIASYGIAAGNAKKSGFDILCVHGAGYLIDQFLTPAWNQRTDEYGGSLENRMRFMMECIDSARAHIGEDFPMMITLTMEQGIKNGKSMEDVIAIAKALEAKGLIALHLRNGSYDVANLIMPTNMDPFGGAVENAAIIKSEVSIPVLVDGALMNPDNCEKIITDKKADMTGIARPLLADSAWVKKASMGKPEDIRPCLRCMECIQRITEGKAVGCSVNPLVGYEADTRTHQADEKKKVLIVGGGQSGLLSALYTSDMGHDVTLVERKSKLGGHMLEGSTAPFKSETAKYLEWILREVEKSNITIKTDFTATESYIKAFGADSVIMCSGSVPSAPPIKGLDSGIMKFATEVMLDDSKVGENVVVVGSGLVGSEAAVDLAMKGKKITLVDMTPEIGMEISMFARYPLLGAMNKLGVEFKTSMKLSEITEEGIIATDLNNEIHKINADTVIIATGLGSEKQLFENLTDEIENIYSVGDCIQPRKFINANREAYAIAGLL